MNAHTLVYYPIISYQRIGFYRVETMDMEITRCNNGVSGNAIPVIATVIIVKGKIFWLESYGVEQCSVDVTLLTPH